MKDTNFERLKKTLAMERKAVNELNSSLNHFERTKDKEEKKDSSGAYKQIERCIQKNK